MHQLATECQPFIRAGARLSPAPTPSGVVNQCPGATLVVTPSDTIGIAVLDRKVAVVVSVEPVATESETSTLIWAVTVLPGSVRPSVTTTSWPCTVANPSTAEANETPVGNV